MFILMIEIFKKDFPVSCVDLNRANVDLSVVICLFEKGVLRWCVLQEYIQSQLQNKLVTSPEIEAVFIKNLLIDVAYNSKQTLLDSCEALKKTVENQDKVNKKAFHFVLNFLIKNDFFTFDLNPTSEYKWWEFYELLLSLLEIFEPAENANELRMEYLILNELRVGSPDIVLPALTDLEFKDEIFPIWGNQPSLIQKCLSKLKKLMGIN